MMSSLRLSLGLALGMVMAFATSSFAANKDLVLEQFLRGSLHAEGQFRNAWTGKERRLTVIMQGTWDKAQRRLTLDEDITYEDGEKAKTTWIFTKKDDGSYSATRDGLEARVTEEEGAVILSYVGYFGGVGLDFVDRLELSTPTSILNTASVKFLGIIPVGSVTLTIHKKGH